MNFTIFVIQLIEVIVNGYFDKLFRRYSTKKKILFGFLLNIGILLFLASVGISGIYKFYKWFDATSKIENVLTLIYKTQLNKFNNTNLAEDQRIIKLDSLVLSFSNLIEETDRNSYSKTVHQQIDTIKILLGDFQYEYRSASFLRKKKYDVQSKLDSLFKEAAILNNGKTTPKSSNGEYKSPFNIPEIRYNLLLLSEIKGTLLFQNSKSYQPEDISQLGNQIYDELYRIESRTSDPNKKNEVENYRKCIHQIEDFILELSKLTAQLNEAQSSIQKSVASIQQAGEEALIQQKEDFKSWGEINVILLIFILIFIAVGGIVLLAVFNKLIKNDEEYKANTQKALFEKQKFLDNIISNSSSLFSVKDVYGKYIIVNTEWVETFGIPFEEAVGKTDIQLFPNERKENFSEYEIKALNYGISHKVEESFTIQNCEHTYLSNIFPILNDQGEPNSVCSISMSLTPLREMQKALERSERDYLSIVSNVPGIVFHCENNANRTIIFISDGVKVLTGYSPGDFLFSNITLSEITHLDDLILIQEEIERAVRSRRPYEIEYRIKDIKGKTKWVYERGTCNIINDANQVTLQGVIVDVTEQKLSLESISSRDKFLEGVADAVKELIVNPAVDEAIKRAMRIIGESANVDQSFVFKNHRDEEGILKTSQLFVWLKGKITTSYRSDLQNINFETFTPRWYHYLSEKQEIIGSFEEFPKEEQEHLILLNCGSLIIIPVFTHKYFWGFIGFGVNDKQKMWSEPEKAIFKAFAVTLGIAIAKAEDSTALIEAKEMAETATRTKSDFLARMSHEIRTPMNAIIGWTHLAMEKEVNAIQSDYLRKIQSSSKALLGIINDILDFSKIEADKLTIEQIDFDLEDVMNDLSSMVSYKGQEKNLEMVFAIDPSVPLSLIGDPLRLTQVLVNLVNNAVKFTAKGEIVVNVKIEDNAEGIIILRFDVRDTGIGLTEDQLTHLFDSFSQGDVSTTRKYGGTGLGLAICKRLTALMGGDIWVDSHYGAGSTFSFTANFALQKSQKKNRALLASEVKGLNVLICDRNSSSVTALAKMVEAFKCNPIITYTAKGALHELHSPKSVKPDIIFIDWKIEQIEDVILQEVDGKQCIIDTPVIVMLTNYNQDDSVKNVKALGLAGILYKPFNFSTILDVMMNALGKTTSVRVVRRNESGYYLKALKKKKGLRVLLVEDNETNQQIGLELIMMAGIKVDIAVNGEEAIDMVKKSGFPSRYTLVFMDIQMPVMDGYKATIEIRKLGIYENLPIIAMTADAIGGALERYLEVGMNGMVAKPIDPEEMYKSILEWSENNVQHSEVHKEETPRLGLHFNHQVAETTPTPKLIEIDGLNVEECLNRLVGRVDFFQRLISRFYYDHQNFEEKFLAAHQANDVELAHRILHSFKGMMGTLAAIEIYPLSIEVEEAYKTKDSSFDMKFKHMVGLLNRLLSEIHSNKIFTPDPNFKSEKNSKNSSDE